MTHYNADAIANAGMAHLNVKVERDEARTKLRQLRAEVGRIANALDACVALPVDAWEPGALSAIARHLRKAQEAAS